MANFSYASRTALDVDGIAVGDPEGPRRSHVRELSGLGAAGGQAVSAHLAPGRARDRRADQGGARMARRSRARRAGDSRRAADRRGLLLLRQGKGRWWSSDRDGRTRGVPALGRHRFARGGAPHDEARLRGHVRSLPQLSDPVARLAGEGARARAPADHLAAAIAPVSRAVRRHPAAGRACACRGRCASSSIGG